MSLGSFGSFNIDYHLGVDGMSLWLVVLSSLITVLGVLASWKLKQQVRSYFMLYLLLSTSIVGCFLALDFFLFYLFFELVLLPMFFLIGLWGGPRRSYASIKFFIYTLVGSLLILVVMIALYLSVGVLDPTSEMMIHSFNLLHMMDSNYFIEGSSLAKDFSVDFYGYAFKSGGFSCFIFRVCYQTTYRTFSYMVTGCPCGSSYTYICDFGSIAFEARRLWSLSNSLFYFPRRSAPFWLLYCHLWGFSYHLWGTECDGAK